MMCSGCTSHHNGIQAVPAVATRRTWLFRPLPSPAYSNKPLLFRTQSLEETRRSQRDHRQNMAHVPHSPLKAGLPSPLPSAPHKKTKVDNYQLLVVTMSWCSKVLAHWSASTLTRRAALAAAALSNSSASCSRVCERSPAHTHQHTCQLW